MLVVYHGAELDEALASLSLNGGALIYRVLCHWLFPGFEPFSNVTFPLLMLGTFLGHAHDTRCTSLLFPPFIPDRFNPVTYHNKHHLDANKNFGFTIATDTFWDWVFGVDTIARNKKIVD